MKKLICLLLIILMLMPCATAEENQISVTLNGEVIEFDQQPTIINNRTMVPFRAIFEALGATVNWCPIERSVTATKGHTELELQIDNPFLRKNWSTITLDTAAIIIEARTFVPVRAIAEGLGVTVDWDKDTRTVILTTDKIAVNNIYPELLGLKKEEVDNIVGLYEEDWDEGPVWVYDDFQLVIGYGNLNEEYEAVDDSVVIYAKADIENFFHNLPEELTVSDLDQILGESELIYNDMYEEYEAFFYLEDSQIGVFCDEYGNVHRDTYIAVSVIDY